MKLAGAEWQHCEELTTRKAAERSAGDEPVVSQKLLMDPAEAAKTISVYQT